jgi:hypothetical protein
MFVPPCAAESRRNKNAKKTGVPGIAKPTDLNQGKN